MYFRLISICWRSKWARIRSRRKRADVVVALTLPDASVTRCAGSRPMSDWPAPSATAISAWLRDSSRLVQLRQQAVLAFELERHLGNQREVDVAAGERRERRRRTRSRGP